VKSLKRRAIDAFAWDFSGNLARQVVTFVLGIYLARLLSPREFGLVGMVMVFIELSQGVVDLALGPALIQKPNPSSLHYNSTFLVNVLMGLLMTMAAFLLAPWIAGFYEAPSLVRITQALAPFFLLRSLMIVPESLLRKRLSFDLLTQVYLAAAIVGGGVGVVMAWGGLGVWSLVAQILLTNVVSVAGLWLFGGWQPRLEFGFAELRELWGFSSPLFAAGMLDQVFTRADTVIVGKLFNASTLGLYSRAKSLTRLVIRFTSESIGQVMFPVLSEILEEKDRFRRVVEQSLIVVCFASLALSGWLFVVATPLILVLLTEKWLAAAPILQLFCLSAYVFPVNSVVLSILKSRGHTRTFLRLEIVKKTLYGVALFVGFQFGIFGFLYALAITGVVNTTINMAVSGRSVDLKLPFFLEIAVPYVAFSTVSAGVTHFLIPVLDNPIKTLLLSTTVFIMLYMALNILFRTKGLRLTITLARHFLERRHPQP